MPSACATACRANAGTCVDAHTVQRPSFSCAVAFIGSMVACASRGAEYQDSSFFAAPAIAPSAPPFEVSAKPRRLRIAAASASRCASESKPAFAPSFQAMSSLSSACRDCHHDFAITATPPEAPRSGGSTETRSTPGIAVAASLSTRATAPPSTGQKATAA